MAWRRPGGKPLSEPMMVSLLTHICATRPQWVDKKKSKVMVNWSKWQFKSLNLDDFTISGDSDKLLLAKQAKYLGLWVRNDLSWDDHILELCRKLYYYFHMFRRLRKILPSVLLLNIYKTYVQSKIDYGLYIWGCTTEVNLNRVQRIQNLLERFICNNFDYIHSRAIDLVWSLKLQTIRERRDYFLCVLMFKCIHGLAPHYLSNDVNMHVDIHGYDTRSAENMDLYIPRCTKGIYKEVSRIRVVHCGISCPHGSKNLRL